MVVKGATEHCCLYLWLVKDRCFRHIQWARMSYGPWYSRDANFQQVTEYLEYDYVPCSFSSRHTFSSFFFQLCY